jgi:hypothetical protein
MCAVCDAGPMSGGQLVDHIHDEHQDVYRRTFIREVSV